MEWAAADDRSVLAVTSDGAEVGEGLLSTHPARKEANAVKIPAKVPTAPSLADWSISLAQALVQASAYSDSAEVTWFRECNEPTYTFEGCSDSGAERFRGLDHKLGTALSTVSAQHPAFKRGLDKHARLLFKQNKIVTGRQMCYLLFHQLKLDDDLGTYYGVQDLVAVEWQGDSAAQVAKFRDRWMRVIENLNPGVTFQEDMLRDILFRKMDVSQAPFFRNDLAHYRREKKDHTYQFLLDSMDRFIDDFTLEHNRAVQAAEYGKGNKSLAVKKGATGTNKNTTTLPTTTGKGNSSPAQTVDTKRHCYFHHNGGCSKGDACGYLHERISKDAIAKLIRPGSRSRSPGGARIRRTQLRPQVRFASFIVRVLVKGRSFPVEFVPQATQTLILVGVGRVASGIRSARSYPTSAANEKTKRTMCWDDFDEHGPEVQFLDESHLPPGNRAVLEVKDEHYMKMYQWYHKEEGPDYWGNRQGYLVRVHRAVRDTLFVPNKVRLPHGNSTQPHRG